MTAKFSASADGSKVTIGNAAEDALQIDATAKTIKALAPYAIQAGPATPQSWQSFSVPSQRALGVNFTNNTAQPISVSVIISSNAGRSSVNAYVNGVVLVSVWAELNVSTATVFFIVPVGASYTLNSNSGSPGISGWAELR